MKNSLNSIAQYALIVSLLLTVPLQVARADTNAENSFSAAERKKWDDALLYAKRSSEQGLYNLMLWRAILDSDFDMPSGVISQFIDTHANWPDINRIQLRYEQALLKENATPSASLQHWFKSHPPISGAGKLLYAQSLLANGGSREKAKSLIREAWVQGDFTSDIEQKIRINYISFLDAKLHEKRADRLVWEGQYSAAKRMSPLLSDKYMSLIEARIALESKDKKAPGLYSKVASSLKNDAGLTYSRLVWRHSKNDEKGAMDMLLAAPKKNVPYPEKWWNYRQRYAREAVDKKQYALATKLLQAHGLESGADFAEAVWLKGWILLEFQKKPEDAYLQFDTLYQGVNFAVSKARAAYWAARAAEKMKQSDVAQSWYQSAAEFPTTFYGQLAIAKLKAGTKLDLPKTTSNSAGYSQFKQSDIGRALRLCMEYNRMDLAGLLIRRLMEDASTPQAMQHIAMLADEQNSKFLGVKAAKRALQYNVLFRDIAYPTVNVDSDVLEAALTHAIIRQESEFDPQARSGSGALGYMQLLPSTAKEVARKLGMSTKALNITHETTNIRLGSTYLSKLVSGFDGSYVLAIASYNAGPGRVRSWTKQFGSPSGNLENSINWIEKIPYAETRNYVQRVLENLQIYRVILEGDKGSALSIEQDILR